MTTTTTTTVRWAIAIFDIYSEVWFARPARAPYNERAWRLDDERLHHNPEEEARELPALGYRPLRRYPVGGRPPSRRQEREIRRALGLARRRGVRFYPRFDAGNPHAQEGWDIRWQ